MTMTARWGGEGVASDLLRTLRYVNGEAADAGRRTARLATTGPSYATMITMTTILRSLWSPFSSSSGGDVRAVMNAVAARHPQFQSSGRNGISPLSAGAHEQQDSHEFFSALVDVVLLVAAEEEEGGGAPAVDGVGGLGGIAVADDNDNDGGGGAVVFSRDNGGRRHRDVESDRGGRGGGAPSPFGSAVTGGGGRFATDDYEEEKKHEGHHGAEVEEARTPPGRSFATASRPPAQLFRHHFYLTLDLVVCIGLCVK